MTLLSILADLNNAVVWMVPTRPVISKFSSPSSNPLVIVTRTSITIGIIVTFTFHRFLNSLVRSRYLSLISPFNFTLWFTGTAKSTILQVFFFFFVDYYKTWPSGRDLMIRLYLKTPEEFVRLSLSDRLWAAHIPFVRMVKLHFPAQFTVPRHILFLC